MEDSKNNSVSHWNGNYYANHSDWQFCLAKTALNYIKISPNSKILDIGCGDGRFTKYIASVIPGSEVMGLDRSPLMLSAAQANVMPNLSFILGDAVHLPFTNQFDCVVAFNSLHWVAEINLSLEQIYKSLLSGGQLLILVVPVQVRHPILDIINKVAKQKRWCSHFEDISTVFPFHTVAEWAGLIESSGLILEHLQLIDASSDFENEQVFADWIKGWIPCGTISENEKKEYIKEIVESYTTAVPPKANGAVRYHLDSLVILASKPITR